MPEPEHYVGIFDSGVGGLTVVRRFVEALPDEPMVYLGDTARVPYGTKSPETVIRYAHACARTLMQRRLKLLIVACNTASAHALDSLRACLDLPVIGVIAPGAAAAAETTRNGRIGVIGTAGTIRSGAYQSEIAALLPDAQVFTQACPLFVPLAEEGWTAGEAPRLIAETYLAELTSRDIDTLVLGCTHYPLLHDVIAEVLGPGVTLVDSALETARAAAETLAAMGLTAAASGAPPARHFMASDAPEGLTQAGRRFLGYDIDHVEWVDF